MSNNKDKPTEETAKKLAAASAKEVFEQLGSNRSGLDQSTVSQQKEKYGDNAITRQEKESTMIRFLKNFNSLMAWLLWVGGAIAFFFTDTPQLGVAIWLVNVVNGLFSFFQENRASKAPEALKKCCHRMPA